MQSLAYDIVDTVREPLVILESDLRVRHANRAFYTTFQTSAADTVGRPFFELAHGQWRFRDLEHLLHSLFSGSGSVEDFEVAHDFEALGRRVMQLNARRIVRNEGAQDLILLAIEDITARREVEESLARVATELRRSNEELERFAFVASHDLQEPLRMVASYTELLARRYEGQLDERADRYIRYATDGARRMQSLINGLLRYSRIARQAAQFADVDTASLVSTVIEGASHVNLESGASITAGHLPVVSGDATLLHQLFQNLVSNAVKFRGEAAPRIRIDARREGPRWHFTVQDNGIGIAADSADSIFLMFRRLHTRTEYPGDGVGLAVCRRIVEHHGGLLTVQSTLGEGSTFHFSLPATEG